MFKMVNALVGSFNEFKKIFYLKRKILFFTVLFLVILTSCGIINSFVMEFNGKVAIIRDGKEEALPVEKDFQVKNNDIIITEELSSAWLRLSDAIMLLLDENSKLSILKSKGSFNLELKSGLILVRIDRPLKTREIFDIVIGNMSLSVRGTAFSVEVEDENSVLLNVYHGSVAICDQAGSETITLIKGQSIRFDSITGELKGQLQAVDFHKLPKTVYEYVEDYAIEAANKLNSVEIEQSEINKTTETNELLPFEIEEEIDLDSTTMWEVIQPNNYIETAESSAITTQNQLRFNSNTLIAPNPPEINFKYLWSDTE